MKTLDDLPELPFEKVLSYLSLKDRLKARAVSKGWRSKFDSYPVKSLCFSERPIGFIYGKGRWVSGTFAENFISSTRFASFFDAFGHTVFANLKHLRLCDLDLRARNETAFARTLNSFDQLETLDMVRVQCSQLQFNLTLPMLTSLHLEKLSADRELILDAPRLRTVRVLQCSPLSLDIVHGESVERLLVDLWQYTEVKKLKSLKYLFTDYLPSDDSTFLSSLEQLKEIHLKCDQSISNLFKQKQRYGRTDLKIYFWGLLLNGPHDPARGALQGSYNYLSREDFELSRLADEIPFHSEFWWDEIHLVKPGLEVDILKRFTDWNLVNVDLRVQNVQRFLDLLKNCKNIVELRFGHYQLQDLFDRLPEHCAVQKLNLWDPPSDLAFLFRLKHLIHLNMNWSIDTEIVRKAFEELPLLSIFEFFYLTQYVRIEIVARKQFRVCTHEKKKAVSDLNAAIELIFGTKRSKKRKAEDME